MMHNLFKIKVFRLLLWITYPISLIFIFPFVLLKKKKKSSLFFFFDRYVIGGAQRVHLDILQSVNDIPKTVYFTRKSTNDNLKNEFYSFPLTKCYDIHFWCDNLLFRLFSVHYYSFFINRHLNARVLGANSTFFYDMLPFINKSAKKTELLHNFSYGNKGMEFFGLANHIYLDKRLVIDNVTQKNIIEQYKKFGISSTYAEKTELIEFGVDIAANTEKAPTPPLKVLYAGRGTPQKRIWLLNAIAEYFIKNQLAVKFSFAGPMSDELSDFVKTHSKVYGEVGERGIMNSLLSESHVVILTSAFEGFPVVIKEGMSHGCVPLVTDLPGNKIHLFHDENALLIRDFENENAVVENGIKGLRFLLDNPEILKRISGSAYKYAVKHFTKADFIKRYRDLLINE